MGQHLDAVSTYIENVFMSTSYNFCSLICKLPGIKYNLFVVFLQSPTCLKITHKMLQKTKSLDLYNCLAIELRLGRSILQNPNSDFFRGVKAILVDKTGRPQWIPSSVYEVTDEQVDNHFRHMSEFGMSEFTPT